MYQPATYDKLGNFYIGVLAGHSWGDIEGENTDGFVGGLYLEYRANRPNSLLAWGIEVDIMRTNLDALVSDGDYGTEKLSQDWLGSVRGKLGLQLTPIFFPYVTAGVGISDRDAGFVGGVGLEANLVANWVVRAEVLRYHLDDPQTVVRGGLGWRF